MKKVNTLTLSFAEIRTEDLPLVGGKGANLGEILVVPFTDPGSSLPAAGSGRECPQSGFVVPGAHRRTAALL